MYIYPAIDLLDGKVVRLTKGAFTSVTEYTLDPVDTARGFRECGARHIHMVDLNGARTGKGRNFSIIERVAALGLFLEVGGGLRDEETIRRYLDSGVSRCILGTVAVKDPDFVARMVQTYGSAIAVGVDALHGVVAVSGWEEGTSLSGIDFCRQLHDMGVSTVIYTDIDRDGMLTGANIPLYKELSSIEGLDIIASGGVTSEADIRQLAQLGLHGAIIGKALYENRVDLKRCIDITREVCL